MDRLDDATAQRIYQDLLDKISASYFDADFAYFRQAIHTPHTFATDGKNHVVKDEKELRQSFDKFCRYLKGAGITNFIRTCQSAAFVATDKIVGEHVSHMIRKDTWTREPYEVRSVLHRIDGAWMVVSSENALPDSSWQAIAFRHHTTDKTIPPQGG